ncbi:hypothetical protein J2X02_002245 [Pseudoxanthomonas japonensis]|jgi:hypothetical protein|uniref:hypothetical protein n=1 Tax=Pseudoxanthomonas TaxID=83618 RepID=UPI0007801EE0|nr:MULTISPECIES: hypothetical protein [Pseudoxanthomonas]MBA3928463.1 hypothetical protein [Xanthomonas sp.]MDR7069394.1 hypothetical protein [Pseudoxanthomonas japonensis]
MRLPLMATLWLVAAPAMAQDATPPEGTSATTMDTLVVRPDPEEVLDLYRFENPIEVEPSAFGNRWKEPTSLEQLGKNGGIVPVLVGLAAQQVQKGVRKIPGWKEPRQAVVARSPPLDEEQAARAVRLHDAGQPR